MTNKPNGHFSLVGEMFGICFALGTPLEHRTFSAKTRRGLGKSGQLVALFLSFYPPQLFRSNWQRWLLLSSWTTFFSCLLGPHSPLAVPLPLWPLCTCLTSECWHSPEVSVHRPFSSFLTFKSLNTTYTLITRGFLSPTQTSCLHADSYSTDSLASSLGSLKGISGFRVQNQILDLSLKTTSSYSPLYDSKWQMPSSIYSE